MFYLNGEMIKKARIMQLILAINILMFIFVNLIWGDEGLFLLSQYNRRVLENGEIYRLFSSMIIHADFQHLLNNCIGIVFYGTAIERLYSKKETIIIYIITGFAGSIATLLLLEPESISLGASGAIFGFMGATLIILMVENKQYIWYTLLFLGFSIYNSFAPGIGTWAHIFGLIAGIIYSMIRKPEYFKSFIRILKGSNK